eukprot:9471072-Pyramimonas_sp.AAC.1
MSKTVVLPLWETTGRRFRRCVMDMMPEWSGAHFAPSATYLGFEVGSGRCQDTWAKAVRTLGRRLLP